MSDQWYYDVNGQASAPVTKAMLGQMVAGGKINRQTLVIREGIPDWTAIENVPELQDLHFIPPTCKGQWDPPTPIPPRPTFTQSTSGVASSLAQWEKRGKIFSIAVTAAFLLIGIMACIMTFGNWVFFLMWLCFAIGAPIGVYFASQSAWENEVTGAVIAFIAAAVVGIIITFCVFLI